MSEWKPGDMAMVTVDYIGGPRRMLRTDAGWDDGGESFWDGAVGAYKILEARPLVVIDPEDAEQVERLAKAYLAALPVGLSGTATELMQAALREFARPTPSIEEPQGRYAVVVDEDENEWVHDGLGHHSGDKGEWWCATAARKNSSAAGRADWADIDAVRILSPGVTP